ncbi:MAG: enolase C-terminal domain-like protein [Acidiferrobacterales bacterium]
MQYDNLTVRALRVRAVDVPIQRPLQTSGGVVETAPLVLIDLETDEGPIGCSYIFCYTRLALAPMVRLLEEVGQLVEGDLVAPQAIEHKLQRRFRLLGAQGLIGMALAGVDMAAWDVLGKAAGLPLVQLLGGAARPIPAYNSTGLGIIGREHVGAEAQELVAPGFRAIKVRLGYPDIATDVAVVRAVREAIADNVLIMTDYNQSLSVPEALQRVHHLDDEGIYWIEEPTRADDYTGHAKISHEARTPIQLGENCWGPHDMAKALAVDASDFFMPDVMKIGGVSGWLRAAALAELTGIPLSSHLFPEISVHLLAVTPTSHWLEYVDWANPILSEPLKVEDGHAVIPDRPGHGIEWNEEGVARYLL